MSETPSSERVKNKRSGRLLKTGKVLPQRLRDKRSRRIIELLMLRAGALNPQWNLSNLQEFADFVATDARSVLSLKGEEIARVRKWVVERLNPIPVPPKGNRLQLKLEFMASCLLNLPFEQYATDVSVLIRMLDDGVVGAPAAKEAIPEQKELSKESGYQDDPPWETSAHYVEVPKYLLITGVVLLLFFVMLTGLFVTFPAVPAFLNKQLPSFQWNSAQSQP